MTPLKHVLIQLIEENGPLPLSRYMAECLCHPEHGFYMRGEPFGRAGHFTTAPEISQMFGELIGLWIGDLWTQQGMPNSPALIELGPGRGTLMQDARRALHKVPGWPTDAPIHFVEISPALRAEQAQRNTGAHWWHDVTQLAYDGPVYIIANEFFDALPIRQFESTQQGWQERAVYAQNGALGLSPNGLDISAMIPQRLRRADVGEIIEICAPAQSIAQHLAERVAQSSGGALIIDYGYSEYGLGDSFQAIANHAFADPLEAPGEADLTAHVNFAALREAAADRCAVHGPVTQGAFLTELGLLTRAKALGAEADAQRLAGPTQMGDLFKVLAFTPHGSAHPAGFGAA
ncbi:MAG: SAM-dependent methyltransferase [Pseudomonadota bacterium]